MCATPPFPPLLPGTRGQGLAFHVWPPLQKGLCLRGEWGRLCTSLKPRVSAGWL